MQPGFVLLLLGLARIAAAQADRLAVCAVELDRGEFAAARDAGEVARQHPESVRAHVLLSRAYMGLNNGAGALQELHAALVRDPDSLDALYYFAKLTGVLSAQEFGVVAQLAPDSARMHQIRAETLEAQDDSQGAEREYLAALAKRPGTTYILNALGDLKRREKSYVDALKWYQQVIAKDPGNYEALYGAGVSYQLSQQGADAIAMFRRALEADPGATAAKMALGEVLLREKKGTEALALLEEAAQADPRFRRLQYLLGKAYQLAGREKDARLAFERFRKLAAEDAEAEMRTMEVR